MQLSRPVAALHPRAFGRRALFDLEPRPSPAGIVLSDDFKLFATTFVCGFVFVFSLIA